MTMAVVSYISFQTLLHPITPSHLITTPTTNVSITRSVKPPAVNFRKNKVLLSTCNVLGEFENEGIDDEGNS